MKEQLEAIGFLVKIYRSYDKCCRALDKKPNMAQTNVFVVSQAETMQMLDYLCRRSASDLRIVVDAEGTSPAEAQKLTSHVLSPEDSVITVACSWEEVLAALRTVSAEASARMGPALAEPPQQGTPAGVPRPVAPEDAGADQGGYDDATPMGSSAGRSGGLVAENPWTLVWISDQAFKPASVPQKAQLESLGCQVKGYKTHKNAARALDKKRALVRTIVLASGIEAAPFLAYMSSRPEIRSTHVVVEASSRAVPVREGTTCQVVEDFDAAVAAVWKIAADPGFT